VIGIKRMSLLSSRRWAITAVLLIADCLTAQSYFLSLQILLIALPGLSWAVVDSQNRSRTQLLQSQALVVVGKFID